MTMLNTGLRLTELLRPLIFLNTGHWLDWSSHRVQEKGEGNEGSIRVCCQFAKCLWRFPIPRTFGFGSAQWHKNQTKPLQKKYHSTMAVAVVVTISYSPIAAYGYTTTQGKIDSKSDSKQNWYISGATVFDDLPLDSNFNSIPKEKTYTIENCTNLHRLSWEVNSTGSAWAANANSWLSLDNIKVSIANEYRHERHLISILASAAVAVAGCNETNETNAGGCGTIRIACRTDLSIDAEAKKPPEGNPHRNHGPGRQRIRPADHGRRFRPLVGRASRLSRPKKTSSPKAPTK